MKGKLDLWFDWKVMGVNAYTPVIVALGLILYAILRKNAVSHVVPALELTFPIFAAWWSIFIFQDVIEEPGSETLFSYPIERWMIGIIRVVAFFLLYMVLMIIMLSIIENWSVEEIFVPLAIQLGVESFFFAGLGFLSMVLTSSTSWSLGILLIYSSTQILTRGTLLPVINVFLFNERPLPLSDLSELIGFCIIFGGALWYVAQLLFKNMQRLN